MEEDSGAFKILTFNPTGKTPPGMPRSRWENNIKHDPKEISGNTTDWIDSTQEKD